MYKLNIEPKVIPTCAGERYRKEYIKKYDDHGSPYLEENGQTDLQALYDSQRASCDLSLIVKNLLDQGVNPYSSKVSILDDIDDFTEIQKSNSADLLIAAANKKSNEDLLAKYKAEMDALNKKFDDLTANQQQAQTGGNNNE